MQPGRVEPLLTLGEHLGLGIDLRHLFERIMPEQMMVNRKVDLAANVDVAREAPPVFGIRLEGRDVLSEYKPTSRGENSAEAQGPFDISVTDGWLDIEPIRTDGGQNFAAPKFSAIEVQATGR